MFDILTFLGLLATFVILVVVGRAYKICPFCDEEREGQDQPSPNSAGESRTPAEHPEKLQHRWHSAIEDEAS